MTFNLRTGAIIGLSSVVIGALLVAFFAISRVTELRDLQARLLIDVENAIEMRSYIDHSVRHLADGQVPDDRWWNAFETLPTPSNCCALQLQQVLQMRGADSNYPVLKERLYVLQDAIAAPADMLKERVEAMKEANQPLPYFVVLSITLMLVMYWSILQRGVLIPIERLERAVREQDIDTPFEFEAPKFMANEIQILAQAFAAVISRLEDDLLSRNTELELAKDSARRESRERAEELAELIDGSGSPIFGVDSKGAIDAWNRKIASLTGVPGETAIGKIFERGFLDASNRIKFHEAVEKALSGQAVEGLEIAVFAKMGGALQLLLNVSPVRSEAGDIIGVTCFGHQVGEFLASTAKLFERQRTTYFNELAGGAAHQLNQPLQKMRLYLANAQNRLRRPEIDKPLLAEKLMGADNELTRMAEIIDHLRLFGKPSSPVEGGFSLTTVVDRCVALVKNGMLEQGIVLKIENELGSQFVNGHPLQLEKCLIAVFDNSREALLEANREGAEIIIRAWLDVSQRCARISIKDNGGGIDIAVIDKIFDPFFTTKIVGKNVGLGLASARALIEDIDGEINLSCSGEFTVVDMSIPLVAESADSVSAS